MRAARAAPRILPALARRKRSGHGRTREPRRVWHSRPGCPPRNAPADRQQRAIANHDPTGDDDPPDQIRERDWQPSTGTLAPLIQLARGETRNATTAPTSSGRPNRPNGSSRRTKSAIKSGSSRIRRSQVPPGNRIDPGATLLTRMLSRASCCAMALARLISDALTALYVIRPPDSRPQIDATITIAPPPRLRMSGTARREARTAGNSV